MRLLFRMPLRILLVDDDDGVRRVLTRMLTLIRPRPESVVCDRPDR